MRVCAKMRCSHEPVATVSLVYTERMVVVDDLFDERDPNLLDLCPNRRPSLRAGSRTVRPRAVGACSVPRPGPRRQPPGTIRSPAGPDQR
ncbi:MAG: DUF3499 family protein [Actinobacteria bacterium]|nr:MAG: DUF3499 family protein [Actinomycetota bacterium]